MEKREAYLKRIQAFSVNEHKHIQANKTLLKGLQFDLRKSNNLELIQQFTNATQKYQTNFRSMEY